MIKVGVFYPYNPGSKFDMKYYLEKHIPMVQQKVGIGAEACNGGAGSGGRHAGRAVDLSRDLPPLV